MKYKILNQDKNLQAYVIGLALGDGNLSSPNGRAIRLRISCDTRYPFLIQKIRDSLEKLLPENKASLVVRKGNCTDVSCYSNHWPNILGWNHKLGSKFQQLVDIPPWIKQNTDYSVNCLRGLIETDGSIYSDRGYPTVMFTSVIPNLANSFFEIVGNLGFAPKLYEISPKKNSNHQKLYHIRISKNVKQFLDLIKPEKR